jgi:hypothetical protein
MPSPMIRIETALPCYIVWKTASRSALVSFKEVAFSAAFAWQDQRHDCEKTIAGQSKRNTDPKPPTPYAKALGLTPNTLLLGRSLTFSSSAASSASSASRVLIKRSAIAICLSIVTNRRNGILSTFCHALPATQPVIQPSQHPHTTATRTLNPHPSTIHRKTARQSHQLKSGLRY